MNPIVLLELVAKWEKFSQAPQNEDGSEAAKIENAVQRGMRAAMAKCADELNLLIKLLARNDDQHERPSRH